MRSLDGRPVYIVLQGFGDGISNHQAVRLSLITMARWLWLILMPLAVYGYILYLYRINRELTVFRYGGYRRWYLEIFAMMFMIGALFALMMALWCGKKVTDRMTWISICLLVLHLLMLSALMTYLSQYFSNISGIVVAVAAVDVCMTQVATDHQIPAAWVPSLWAMFQRSQIKMEGGFHIIKVVLIQLVIILLAYIGCICCRKYHHD